MRIADQIEKLDIKPEFKSIFSEWISAELFNTIKVYNPSVICSKYMNKDRDDLRVWIEVVVRIEKKDIAAAQLRPFIEKATLTGFEGCVEIRRTFFLYEDSL